MGERISNENVIDVGLVRHYIRDREAKDNPLLLDLEFQDDEITRAMQLTAMDFNGIAPFTTRISAKALPMEMYILKGVVSHLYTSLLQQIRRNEVEYAAGNAVVNIDAKRIEFLTEWSEKFKQEFENGVWHAKQYQNFLDGFRAH